MSYGAATVNAYDHTPIATECQYAFIVKLCAERGIEAPASREHVAKTHASSLIDRLLATPKVRPAPKPQPTQGEGDAPSEDGMYVLDGVIYKVQYAVHGSGRLYAKRLVAGESGKSWFEYAPGLIHKLRPAHKLTREQAREWGALYGTCCRCGRTLTAEDSIERMMGPVCYGKMGW